MNRRRISVLLTICTTLALFALLSFSSGRAWPYPVMLPRSFEFHGNTYHRNSTCLSLAELSTSRHRLHRVGSLPSVLWLGERGIYSYTLRPDFSRTYDYVAVQDDDCYRIYIGDKQL